MSEPMRKRWKRPYLLVGAVVLLVAGSASAQGLTTGSMGALGAGGLGGAGIGGAGLGGLGGAGLGGGLGGAGLGGAGLGGGLAGGAGLGGGLAGGGGFAGATGGTGLGFTGGASLGFLGGTTGAGIAGGLGRGAGFTGTTAVGPQATNPFRAYYGSPLAMGYPTGAVTGVGAPARTPVFGQPTSGTTQTLGTATTGALGLGAGGLGTGLLGGAGGTLGGLGAAGLGGAVAPGGIVNPQAAVRRTPSYTTTLGFAYSPPAPSQLEANVQGVLDRSTSLSPNRNIRVVASGQTIILRGRVPNARDRRLAEALIRLEPGVRAIRNEITVASVPTSR
jgi:hypothetical protein